MKKALLAGATGYLGRYIAKALYERGFSTRAIARNTPSLKDSNILFSEIIDAELTIPNTIEGCCNQIEVVISTVGITRQKDELTYMDVDYQANLNLLREAQKSGVHKFIYVSVLNGEKLRHLKLCDAKERFVEQLKGSGLDYCIIRPNGFFSDMTEFYNMAKKGRIYLFGNGELKTNPIHGEDLATVCVDAIENQKRVVQVGGPEILTQNEIAKTAFAVLKIDPKITHIPDWIRMAILKLTRTFTGSETYGSIEFFLTVMSIDMVAPQYGKHTLKEYFTNLKQTRA
jgi:uncharacterized protein YbjT (DUF2867 family)